MHRRTAGKPADDRTAASEAHPDPGPAAILDFLATAPPELQAWAQAQAAAIHAAYGGSITRGVGPADAAAPAAHAVAPVRSTGGSASDEPAEDSNGLATTDEEIDELLASVTPSAHRDAVSGGSPTRPSPRRPAVRRQGGAFLSAPVRRLLVVAGALVAIAVVAMVGYGYGNTAPAASPGASADAAAPTFDSAAVAGLMAKIQANPNDVDSMMGIGDQYFTVGDYQTAITWFSKAAIAAPTDPKPLLAQGAATFNSGDNVGAEKVWKAALVVDPNNVEAHYDLGFLYLNAVPPDMAGVQREWNLVVQLAPGSDVASSVQTHLNALASQLPTASPAAVPGATTPAASSVATPAVPAAPTAVPVTTAPSSAP